MSTLWARRLALAAVPLVLAGAAAPALQAQDNRLVTVTYDPNAVVQIRGRVKVQATIRFADDERIENVAIGDSNAWQVTPNKRANLLFIKPLQNGATTNMTVVTNARTYFFDLIASNTGKPVYVLNFDYPVQPGSTATPLAAPADLAVAQPAAEKTVDPASLNFDWKRKGERKLLPERAYDDGEATFLTWPEGRPVPAILILSDDGKTEGPVNFSVRGDVVVVDGVPPVLVLRSGKDRAELTYGGAPLEQRRDEARASEGQMRGAPGMLARNEGSE
ncbi:TrbG/VirB9 family P-type conjugative transfer protein [Porphyrobacter sp. GA68]|uniref:TrbG/VirB9 family P-type conjugative transfer protein n=1 Tax=Porphyrobacter sp. GA68 TaxID=2883480 RepID=UPI001D1936BC|nr:TrbG/VirB9 family P-type conjugative transfer protein [Porphyrobacter sp. GA68]